MLEMREILIVQDDLFKEVLYFFIIKKGWQFVSTTILYMGDLNELSMFSVL